MQNESPVAVYLNEVLGIRSFIRSSEQAIVCSVMTESSTIAMVVDRSSAAEIASQQVMSASSAAPRTAVIQVVVEQELSPEERTLIEKMMGALKVNYELRVSEGAPLATTYLLWGEKAKQKFGFNVSEVLTWKEQENARYFLGCDLRELLGANADVTTKKKQIWTELQCLKK